MKSTLRTARLLVIFGLIFLIGGIPARSQQGTDIASGAITLNVRAGFDGAFRDQQWMPIAVQVRNDGPAVRGRLVVRPETSGNAILGTYSTPVDLPEGAQQSATFAIIARGYANQIRVELIDEEGLVVASAGAVVQGLQGSDRLYVVITQSPAGAAVMTGARVGGYTAAQANWQPVQLPDRAALLDPVDALLIHDADTGTISDTQRAVLTDWITAGGHLIVMGGANWQATAAGVRDLLPLVPDGSTTASLAALGDWLRTPARAVLNMETTVATGSLTNDAQALVTADDGTILVARRTLGGGTIDYVTADPNNLPLRGWTDLPELWFTLTTTTNPPPSWSMGMTDWEQAASAAQILPGLDALPDVLPLCGFLFGYIALIGPVNYWILNRINRREWAWITIPALIVLFTVLAFAVGATLRGTDATLNRLAVVRAWDQVPTARTEGVIGLLSPRRETYTLSMPNGETLRPIPRTITGTSLLVNAVNAVDAVAIEQSDVFTAADFLVDASFIEPFALSGGTTAPAISGQVTLSDDTRIEGQILLRGSVRNDADFTLMDPVILARGVAEHLDQPLAPGEVLPFSLMLPGEGQPSPMIRIPTVITSLVSARNYQLTQTKASVIDILGPENFGNGAYSRAFLGQSVEALEMRRRQFFLSSFIDDNGTTGRGDQVYLAGWGTQMPFDVALEGADWASQDTTVYLISLATTYTPPSTPVTIPRERFSWVTIDQSGADANPNSLDFNAGEYAAFRFTPFPNAVLREVDSLTVRIGENASGTRAIPLQVWNYEVGAWEDLEVTGGELVLRDPAPYLGAQNAVQVKISSQAMASGFLRITGLGVEQRGTY
ncbi:MAG: hypothetical protein U0670_18635 [Anaerolineae bacterium]